MFHSSGFLQRPSMSPSEHDSENIVSCSDLCGPMCTSAAQCWETLLCIARVVQTGILQWSGMQSNTAPCDASTPLQVLRSVTCSSVVTLPRVGLCNLGDHTVLSDGTTSGHTAWRDTMQCRAVSGIVEPCTAQHCVPMLCDTAQPHRPLAHRAPAWQGEGLIIYGAYWEIGPFSGHINTQQ